MTDRISEPGENSAAGLGHETQQNPTNDSCQSTKLGVPAQNTVEQRSGMQLQTISSQLPTARS